MSMDVNKLLNGTLAGQMAQSLDQKDGEANGKINESIWNEFIKEIRNETGDDTLGNEIKNYITVENAMNAITRYAIKAVNKLKGNNAQNKDVDDKAQEWANLIDGIKTGDTQEEEVVVSDTEQPVSDTPEVEEPQKVDSGIEVKKLNAEYLEFSEKVGDNSANREFIANLIKNPTEKISSSQEKSEQFNAINKEQWADIIDNNKHALMQLTNMGQISLNDLVAIASMFGIEPSTNKTALVKDINKAAKTYMKSINHDKNNTENISGAYENAKDAVNIIETGAAGNAGITKIRTEDVGNGIMQQTRTIDGIGVVKFTYNESTKEVTTASVYDKDNNSIMTINGQFVNVPNSDNKSLKYDSLDPAELLKFIQENYLQ